MSTNNRNNKLLQKLIDGNLTAEERFSLEKEALDDSLLFEAIEGISESSANHNHHIESILAKIKDKQKEKKVLTLVWPIAAAAGLLLLFTIGIKLTQDNNSIAATEQNPIAALEDVDTQENDNANEIAVAEDLPFQKEKVSPENDESLNNIPNAKAQSTSALSSNAIKEESKKAPSQIVTIPAEENKSAEEVAVAIKVGDEVEENILEEEVIVDSRTEPPPAPISEVPSRINRQALDLNLAENASASSGKTEGLSKRKSIIADLDFDSHPALTNYISTQYEKTFTKKLDAQGLEFLITLIEGKNVSKVEQISGNKEFGDKIIPFIKEYKEWKLLNRSGELQFTYIFNSK